VKFYEIAESAFSDEKLIRLNIGDTKLPTPPEAVEAAVRFMQTRKATYSSAAGLPAFRERIARREGCAVENVVVGPGSKHLLFALMSTMAKAGDKVAVPLPAWPAYGLIARQLGLQYVELPTRVETGWCFEASGIAGARLVVLCNPVNPTSTVYPPALVQETLDRAKAQGALVILDEAYKGGAFEPVPTYEAIRIRSFSKEFSMEGWRLGYAVAPKEVVDRVVAFNQITNTCVAEFVQEAGMACLEHEERILAGARAIWHERAKVASAALRKVGFRFAEPQSGLYVFAEHERITDDQAYVKRLMEKEGVAVAPGSSFGPFTRHVRICVNQEGPRLEEAVARMARGLE